MITGETAATADPSPSAHETRNRECESRRLGAQTRAPEGRPGACGVGALSLPLAEPCLERFPPARPGRRAAARRCVPGESHTNLALRPQLFELHVVSYVRDVPWGGGAGAATFPARGRAEAEPEPGRTPSDTSSVTCRSFCRERVPRGRLCRPSRALPQSREDGVRLGGGRRCAEVSVRCTDSNTGSFRTRRGRASHASPGACL